MTIIAEKGEEVTELHAAMFLHTIEIKLLLI